MDWQGTTASRMTTADRRVVTRPTGLTLRYRDLYFRTSPTTTP